MIRFDRLPANEKSVDQMVTHMRLCGFDKDEAQKLADDAASLVLATFRGLDEKIIALTPDETDQGVVQQLVLMQLVGIGKQAMELNALDGLMKLFGGERR